MLKNLLDFGFIIQLHRSFIVLDSESVTKLRLVNVLLELLIASGDTTLGWIIGLSVCVSLLIYV